MNCPIPCPPEEFCGGRSDPALDLVFSDVLDTFRKAAMISRLLKWFRGSDNWAEESLDDLEPDFEPYRPPVVTPRAQPVHQRVPGLADSASAEPPEEAPFAPDENEPVIRNKYVREDTGTHETLKILDDSLLDSSEEEGFDPYNTGDFDRSRNWEKRFKKT